MQQHCRLCNIGFKRLRVCCNKLETQLFFFTRIFDKPPCLYVHVCKGKFGSSSSFITRLPITKADSRPHIPIFSGSKCQVTAADRRWYFMMSGRGGKEIRNTYKFQLLKQSGSKHMTDALQHKNRQTKMQKVNELLGMLYRKLCMIICLKLTFS